MAQSNRLEWLDIAKGIAIILMVIGHSSIPQIGSNFIFAFHMPLFFIASGWVSNYQKSSFKRFIEKKWSSLLIPFFYYSGIVMVLMQCIGILDVGHLFMHGWGGYALWFIPVLFTASVVVRAAFYLPDVWHRRVIMLGLFFLGLFLSCHGISLPWQLSNVPYASFLVMTGNELAKCNKRLETPARYWDILLLALCTLTISYFWRLDMAFNLITPIIPLTIGALMGTWMIFRLSMWLERKVSWCANLLQRVGKETYIVVAFSQIVIMVINHYVSIHPAIKYFILLVTLILIKYAKDGIVHVYHKMK